MSARHTSRRAFVLTTLIAAVTASAAAALSAVLGLAVWAMFVGWIAFYSRGLDSRSMFENLACVGLGMTVGALASLAVPQVAALAGPAIALPAVVFVVALLVVSLRALPAMNNLLGYFLGLVAWFAAHLDPSLENLAQLFYASAIGSGAGWAAHRLPASMAQPA